MTDREKVICGWERCRKHTCPSIDSKEYADCEYTVGLYCRQDLLIDDTIALLKEQEEKPLRCKTCTMRDKTGFCHRWNIEVKEDDYCSFGAWKGC